MFTFRRVPLAIVLAFVVGPALAQTAAEHAQHKAAPSQPSAQSIPSAQAQAATGDPGNAMAAMDETMKAMHAMHEKMDKARTPQERNALMADHMKIMQEGMAMMNRMRGMDRMHAAPAR